MQIRIERRMEPSFSWGFWNQIRGEQMGNGGYSEPLTITEMRPAGRPVLERVVDAIKDVSADIPRVRVVRG